MSSAQESHGAGSLWNYNPSFIGGIIATSIFGILTFAHIFRIITKKTKICIPFIFAAFNEAMGWLFRVLSHNNTSQGMFFMIQFSMLLISPIMAAAGLYAVVRCIMQMCEAAERSPVHPRLFARTFGIVDMVCILMITVGGTMGMQGNKAGDQVLLGGLGIQSASFSAFAVITFIWHRRITAAPTVETKMMDGTIWSNMWFMYAALACIKIRNAGRFAEFLLGKDGFLQQNEWTLFVYDLVPVAIALAACLKFYGQDFRSFRERGMMELRDEDNETSSRSSQAGLRGRVELA